MKQAKVYPSLAQFLSSRWNEERSITDRALGAYAERTDLFERRLYSASGVQVLRYTDAELEAMDESTYALVHLMILRTVTDWRRELLAKEMLLAKYVHTQDGTLISVMKAFADVYRDHPDYNPAW